MLIKLLFYLLRLIPVRIAGAIGAGMGRIAYLIDGRHRRIAMRNLDRIYPEQTLKWKRRISRESFAELGRTSFELPHVYLRSKAFLLSRIEVENEHVLIDALKQNKGAILAACHHSNWELGALSLSMLDHESDLIYRSVRQPALNRFTLDARKRFGASMHARDEGLRWMPKALKQNHCLGVMIDQHLSNGAVVQFLGHAARTTTMPAIFTNKHQTPVLGVALHRIGRSFRFRLEYWPVPIDPQMNDEIATMQIICDSFAPLIHQRPELWLWIHRRWLYLDEQEDEQQALAEQATS